jgi:hypothetical protein
MAWGAAGLRSSVSFYFLPEDLLSPSGKPWLRGAWQRHTPYYWVLG